ncbi:MAG: hypothetical protein FVQ77_01150 [Cytophagales bacterium]|nr:hypothetical protein [Cytophagales bacterium]
MIRLLIIWIFNIFLGESLFGQDHPDWRTLVKIDEAQAIVIAKMHVEDSIEGYGTLSVLEVLKEKQNLRVAKVQFSDKHKKRNYTKGIPMPTYWYNEGQEGIWLLMDKDTLPRYELRQSKLYYDKKWASWIKEQCANLQNRKWTNGPKQLAGSVIVDDVGGNKSYRFFYLCLRNDSKETVYINTFHRIVYNTHGHSQYGVSHSRYEASIITPQQEQIDMINGHNPDILLYGMPGWVEPTTRDFAELKPGKTIYLPATGDLRCFLRKPSKGTYLFQASYHNNYKIDDFYGNIWTGEIIFPVARFTYDYVSFENKK